MRLGFTEKKIGRRWIVICGNYNEFSTFCDIQLKDYSKGKNLFEGDEFIYYSSPDSIRGIRADGVITYGTYKDREDINYDYLEVCVRYK